MDESETVNDRVPEREVGFRTTKRPSKITEALLTDLKDRRDRTPYDQFTVLKP